jgi:DNA-binding MarR family transcriptional regulator
MPIDIHDIDAAFDRLCKDVSRSNYTEFKNSISIFISECKRLKYYSDAISQIPTIHIPTLLEESKSEENRGNFPWPTNANDKFTCKWNLITEVAKPKPAIEAYHFATDYLGDYSDRLDDLLFTFVDKIFQPVTDELRSRAHTLYAQQPDNAFYERSPSTHKIMPKDHSDDPLFFISHSSKDKDLAECLVHLLKSCFGLKASNIRCTSVPGYTHSSGSYTDETLRKEAIECKCLIALLTPSSIQSTYVIFELGARWGAQRPLFPVVSNGLSKGNLPPPLNAINAKDLAVRTEILDFIDDIELSANITKEKTSVWDQRADGLMQKASELSSSDEPATQSEQQRLLDDHEMMILHSLAEAEDKGITVTLKSFTFMEISKSKLTYHLDNLEKAGFISVAHSMLSRTPSVYRLSRAGRQLIHEA